MRDLDATELLDLWERGLTQSWPGRAVTLLRAAWPGAAEGDVLEWSIGLRDARLLALRRRLFGPDLTVLLPCPACGDAVESTFRVEDVLLLPEALPGAARGPNETVAVEQDGYLITFRLPVCRDLLALAETPPDVHDPPRERLLSRCVTDVRRSGGAPAELSGLPGSITAAVASRMSAADPQADVQLACTCPACGAMWSAVFDIATVLWNEIHAWARRLLCDVHALARAYGWREPDVLTLSPTRRRVYLELAGS